MTLDFPSFYEVPLNEAAPRISITSDNKQSTGCAARARGAGRRATEKEENAAEKNIARICPIRRGIVRYQSPPDPRTNRIAHCTVNRRRPAIKIPAALDPISEELKSTRSRISGLPKGRRTLRERAGSHSSHVRRDA